MSTRSACRLLTLSLLLWLAPVASPASELPRLELIECWFEPPEGRRADCARLHVAQSRGQPSRSEVVLPLVIYRSNAAQPRADPVVLLGGGGPGNSVGIEGEQANDWWEFLDRLALAGGRDVIVIDQRGAGLSEPRLDCDWSEYDTVAELSQSLPLRRYVRQLERVLLRCRTDLAAAGVDLSAWDAGTSAADLEDLRRLLGIERWNLYGTSYAARIALAILREYPGSVRSAILDSPVTPEVRFYEASPAAVERAFDAVFAACEADTDCATLYPQTREVLARVVQRLQRRPLRLEVSWPETLAPFRMTVDGERLIEILFQALYGTQGIARLPLVIHALDRGSNDLLAPLARELVKQYLGGGWSDGLYYAVMCREELPFNDLETALLESEQQPVYGDFNRRWLLGERAACQVWEAEPADAAVELPVAGDTPVLILAGRLDPVTPPAWGRAAARRLPNAWFQEFPGVGHDVLGSDACAREIAAGFLQAPQRDPRDAPCLGALPGPWFDLDH